MKKKVLIGTVNLEVGGIEKTLIGLLKRIDYSNYDIDLLLLKTNGDFINEIPDEVNIITPYKSSVLERICNSKSIICKLIKHLFFNYYTAKLWVKKNEYSTVISYAGYYPFIDSYIMNTKANNKLIWVHTDLNYVYKTDKFYKMRIFLTKKKYNRFNKIVCVSESIRKEFIKLFPNLEDKTTVQWNIVDINKNNKEYPKLKGKQILVSVGRICRQKRFDKLVFVHKKLIQSGFDVTTYLVGDGEEKEYIESLIKKFKVTDSFIMLGKQLNVEEIIKQANLFVLTSDYEGLPTVLFEALDSNVPFIGTKVCGTKDVAQFIAPKDSYILVNNNITDIYEGVIEGLNGKVNKNFKFKIENYNKNCLDNFYKLLDK